MSRTYVCVAIAGSRIADGNRMFEAKWMLVGLVATGCTVPALDELGRSIGGSLEVAEVIVMPDGSFFPHTTYISDGSTVRFVMHDRRDSVIPATSNGSFPSICDTPKAYVASDPANFTGPMPVAASGIFTLNPNPGDLGLVELVSNSGNPCGAFATRGRVGDRYLCASGPRNATMDSTWEDENITGVFIRLKWNDLVPDAAGDYHFDDLTREVEKAVANGKLFTLAIEAGKDGTPDWIFSSEPGWAFRFNPVTFQLEPYRVLRPGGGGGVERLSFQDYASDSDADTTTCGQPMDLGSPADLAYAAHYSDLLLAVANHLKSNAAWYRALAYIKPSGANLFTAENRLPKRCKPGCLCNTRVWSDAGYTPNGLEWFYAAQMNDLHDMFPGKTMSYSLIQDGFPQVDNGGGYVDENGIYQDGNGAAAPNMEIGGLDQSLNVINEGQSEWGLDFAVQHCGLQPAYFGVVPPQMPECSSLGNPGCPNRWVVQEGLEGQYIGFQTQNIQKIDDGLKLETALDNAWRNSNATFVEIYEERAWQAKLEGGLHQEALGWWADRFHSRREGISFPIPLPPAPITFEHTFHRTPGLGEQAHYFIHASTDRSAARRRTRTPRLSSSCRASRDRR